MNDRESETSADPLAHSHSWLVEQDVLCEPAIGRTLMPVLRIELPPHLRQLTRLTGKEVHLAVKAPVTLRSTLDALEARYPQLRGTIRDHSSKERRAFLRFFVCEEDWSHYPVDTPLPGAIVSGAKPLLIIGALAGG